MELTTQIQKIAKVDIFKEGKAEDTFVGRPFYIDYETAHLLIADAWKAKTGGIPQGTFLLAFYENEDKVAEALLLRALEPVNLPTHNDIISSMIEYYKDNLKTAGKESKLDEFTRYEFSFSGLKCRILGTFYRDADSNVVFGADVENFFSAHNYRVFKPAGDVLEKIANLRDGDYVPGSGSDIPIGKIRYSSSTRYQEPGPSVPVYISPTDFLGKRTALFGMTRTGKSNTVKKIIESTVYLSKKAPLSLAKPPSDPATMLKTIDPKGFPVYPVGQIIFDINGEYANPNMQDEGTAIFEMFEDLVIRYSVIEKEGFKVMKTNFFKDVPEGFSLIQSGLSEETSDYVRGFLSFDIAEPDPSDHSATTRYARQLVAYLCCLYKAGFTVPAKYRVKFPGNNELNGLAGGIDPSKGISLEEATTWFSAIWDNQDHKFFSEYRSKNGKEWVDDDLRNILIMLTRKRNPGSNASLSGFIKLQPIKSLHTDTQDKPFADEILEALLQGKIIIVDLSQGDPKIQQLYSERICRRIFSNSMDRFIKNFPNNFIQFYFEEAHNLFPKKDDKDLSQIYNRIAKEGAKLNLGLIYATQEVSSISSNILKNTQNWFIAHLNNDDELKELRKYYDFADFAAGLIRFSAGSDKGFVRMKTYSNPFIVPVQIDRFTAEKEV
jgi:DNA helicase HerA-like ATPase